MTHINKIKYFGFLSILMAFVFLIMVSCLSPLKNDTGTLIISIPETDSGNARSAALPAEMIQEMHYIITISRNMDIGNDELKPIDLVNKTKTTIELAPGKWFIQVTAFYTGGEIAAYGSCDVVVEAGRTSYATVTMTVIDEFVTPVILDDTNINAVYWLGEKTDPISAGEILVNFGESSYQWYKNTTDNNDIDTAKLIQNADASDFTPPSDDIGVLYYFPVITNTYPGKKGDETISATGNTVKVEILGRNSANLQKVINSAEDRAVIELPGGLTFMMYSTVTINREITITTKGSGDVKLLRDTAFIDDINAAKSYLFNVGNGGYLKLSGKKNNSLVIDGNNITASTNRSSLIKVNDGILEMGDEVYLSGNTISSGGNNGSNGGAVTVSGSGSLFTMNGGGILYNTAVRGGGVYIEDGADFKMNGGAIYSNKATNIYSEDAGGGGVYITGNGTEFTMSGGIIGSEDDTGDGNESAMNGGGVAVLNGAKFTMSENAKIKYNIDNGLYGTGGGGVIIKGFNSNFTMNDDAEVSYNQSYTGGGVAVDAPVDSNASNPLSYSFIMNGGKVNSNISEHPNFTNGAGPGGGVRVYNGSSFLMKDGEINYNISKSEAGCGGVAVNRGVFTMEGGTIGYNGGGGVGLTATGIGNKPHFTMTGGSIEYNETGIGYDGGGVYVGGGCEFIMDGGSITGNTASKGGGVYLDADGNIGITEFTMTGGFIEDNESGSEGGGVYVNCYCKFTLGGTAVIRRNIASSDGGGVFLDGVFSQGGKLYLYDSAEIYENEAHNGRGGGVCLDYNGMNALFEINTPAALSSVHANTAPGYPSAGQVHVGSGDFLVDGVNNNDY